MRRRQRYTIDELAAETGVATRSIRYYQTLGLLPSPAVEGRTGFYDGTHVERLELIKELQSEGLNLQAIGWLIGGAGQVDSRELRRLKHAMLDGWMAAEPKDQTTDEVLAAFGEDSLDAETVRRAQELRLVEATDDPDRWRVILPEVLAAGQELAQVGMEMSPDRALDVLAEMRAHTRAIADAFVELFDETVLAPWDARGRPDDEWPAVRAAIDRMRPLASEAVLSVFQQAMAEAVADQLGDMQPADAAGGDTGRAP
ncbi:MAG: MerR family transcriptional regulator [Nitriliruptorales bacterium]|nr:MerR family transcriptional regulator [Nitriliruptorales bacterium]